MSGLPTNIRVERDLFGVLISISGRKLHVAAEDFNQLMTQLLMEWVPEKEVTIIPRKHVEIVRDNSSSLFQSGVLTPYNDDEL